MNMPNGDRITVRGGTPEIPIIYHDGKFLYRNTGSLFEKLLVEWHEMTYIHWDEYHKMHGISTDSQYRGDIPVGIFSGHKRHLFGCTFINYLEPGREYDLTVKADRLFIESILRL